MTAVRLSYIIPFKEFICSVKGVGGSLFGRGDEHHNFCMQTNKGAEDLGALVGYVGLYRDR